MPSSRDTLGCDRLQWRRTVRALEAHLESIYLYVTGILSSRNQRFLAIGGRYTKPRHIVVIINARAYPECRPRRSVSGGRRAKHGMGYARAIREGRLIHTHLLRPYPYPHAVPWPALR